MQSQPLPSATIYDHEPVASSPVMTTGDWFVTQLILAIPLVNIIMLLVWAFGSSGNPNRRNFCRSSLIWALIALVIYAIIFAVMLSTGALNEF